MSVFTERRQTMIESQLRTNKVIDVALLHAFETVPKEEFIAPELRGLAYVDEDLMIGHGRFILEPMVFAKLIQALDLNSDDSILDIAAGCGYSTSILACLGQSVVGIEANQELAGTAQKNMQHHSIDNAVILHGEHTEGFEAEGPYDAIVIEGALAQVPEKILHQLSTKGKLVTILRQHRAGPGKAVMFRRAGDGFKHQILFDAQTPVLEEFNQSNAFIF